MHKHTYANTQTHTRSNNKLNNITSIKITFHVLYTCTNIHMQTRKDTHVPITNLITLH